MKKKTKKSKTKKQNNKMFLFIIFFIVLILITFIVLRVINKEEQKKDVYYTGNIYSLNYAASLLDSVDNGKNILISPFNINSNIAYLYNGVDNNSYKEIKNYFGKDDKKVNQELFNKLKMLDSLKDNNEYDELYLSLINELESKGYDKYSLSNISSLDSNGKKELQLLLKKLSLTYDCIIGNIEINKNAVSNYVLSEKEILNSDYGLKNLLDTVLDNYETYIVSNKVVNYTEIMINGLDLSKIDSKFIDNVSNYNNVLSVMAEDVNVLNSKIKEISDGNISRIGSAKLLNDNVAIINSLYFDYAWEIPFNSSYVNNSAFRNINGTFSEAQMMYSEENIYLENEHAVGFIKPFKDKKYNFMVVVPKDINNFELSKLNLDGLLRSAKNKTILVGLPKFSYQSEVDLKRINEEMGIKEIYTKKANFTKMTDYNLFINDNIQKNSINIGEKGTRDSNINKDIIETFAYDENVDNVIINQPFAFAIINNETKDIMLLGKVVEM